MGVIRFVSRIMGMLNVWRWPEVVAWSARIVGGRIPSGLSLAAWAGLVIGGVFNVNSDWQFFGVVWLSVHMGQRLLVPCLARFGCRPIT